MKVGLGKRATINGKLVDVALARIATEVGYQVTG
jgi:hypothetical protein